MYVSDYRELNAVHLASPPHELLRDSQVYWARKESLVLAEQRLPRGQPARPLLGAMAKVDRLACRPSQSAVSPLPP